MHPSCALLVLLQLLSHRTSAFELWVGGFDLSPSSNVVRWVADNGTRWADGISVGFPAVYSAQTDLEALTSAGLRLLPCVHANLETMQRQLFGFPSAAPNTDFFRSAYTQELPAFQAAAEKGSKGPFLWWALTEDDSSGVGFPFEQLALPPTSHSDAWAQFDAYLQRSQVLSSALFPGTPLVAQVGFAEQIHAHFERGVFLAVVERANDDIADLPTALAFARGAARQYNASFGIDLSWWWGVVYGGVNDLPGLYHRRHAFLALFGGASVVNIEGGDGLCDANGKPLALGQEMQNFGLFARSLSAPGLVMARTPATPVLVVLPKDHGYATRPYWSTQDQAWGYARLPPRVGDRGVRGFFDWVFPGAGFSQDPFPFGAYASDDPPASPWAMSAQTAPYAPHSSDVNAAAPYLPFGTFPNRTAAGASFAASNVDPSPWRPMADSTWGGVFDVAVAGLGMAQASSTHGAANNVFGRTRKNTRAKAPRRPQAGNDKAGGAGGEATPPLPLASGYKLCVLLGPINMTSALKAQLLGFAAGGGRVVVAAGVVGPADGDLTGLGQMAAELRVGRSWVRTGQSAHGNLARTVQEEPFRFVPVPSPGKTSVLATTVVALPICGNAPCALAVEWAVGQGAITTLLVPWMEARDGLSSLARAVLGDAIDAVVPVRVSWAPGAGWPVDFTATADRKLGLVNVVVSNNEEAAWAGNVTFTAQFTGPASTVMGCAELRSGQALNFDQESKSLALTLRPFDVAVVECHVVF